MEDDISKDGSTEAVAGQGETTQANYRFKLWHAFYAITLLAVYVSLSFLLVVPTLVWFGICSAASKAPNRLTRVCDACGLLAVVLVVGFPLLNMLSPVGGFHFPSFRTECGHNIRQLQLGLLNYESANLHFPMDSEKNDQGQLMHSWRVRILPFVEEEQLYDQYDFRQPWDSPNNLKLLDQMPNIFRCPCSKHTNKTHYKLVVGPGSLFDGDEATFERIRDGSSNTVSIIEDSRNPVPWTKPEDITIEQAVELVVSPGFDGLPHVYKSKFQTQYSEGNVAFYDGSIHQLGMCDSPPETVRLMFGINDGEIVDYADIGRSPRSIVIQHASPPISLIVFTVLMLVPLKWVIQGRGIKPAGSDR